MVKNEADAKEASTERKWRIETSISVLALAVSIVSFWLSAVGTPGTVRPLRPSGYGLIREIGPFPSDHIVIPLEWENTSGRPVLVRRPCLHLRELGSDGQETGNVHEFPLAGEYTEISTTSFLERYAILNSFTVPAHSISVRVLVFHTDRWWDSKHDLHKFRFKAGKKYRVYISYQLGLEQQSDTALFDATIHERADIISRETGDWWDFWYLDY